MKKISIITMSLLLFAGGLSFAQSTKYKTRAGIVKESTMKTDKNGKPKKIPLKGVIIETNEQARATSSDSGTFKLNISKAPFKITKAAKAGYTLLTPEAGKTTYNDGKDIINILLVKKDNMNSRVGSQTKTATENNEKKEKESLLELEKRKDRGEITTSEYLRMKDSITKVYSDRLKTLIDYCEESAKRWFMGQEIIDQQIDEAIIKGEFDKAVSLIESKGTTKQRTEEIENSKAAYENHKKLAQQHDELAEKHKEVYESKVKSLVLDHRNRANIKLMEVKYSEALAYLDSARVLQEKYLGLQDIDLALTYHIIGFVYGEQDNLDKAMEFYNKALKIEEQVLNPLSPDLAATYNNIGWVYGEQGYDDKAMEFYNKALKIEEQVLNPLSPDLAATYNNIGTVYYEQENYDKAMEFYDKALKIEEQVLDSLSPDLATSYNNIGMVYDEQGYYDKAMEFYDKALKIREQVLNPLSPALATSYGNIGTVYHSQENYDKAMEFHDKALKIFEQVLNPLSPDLATLYNNIGGVYYVQKNYDKALVWLNKALKIREQVLNPLSPDLADSYSNIGTIYLETENYDKALEYFKKALPGYIKAYGEENEYTQLIKQAIEILEEALGE